jgi:hypothetical protein
VLIPRESPVLITKTLGDLFGVSGGASCRDIKGNELSPVYDWKRFYPCICMISCLGWEVAQDAMDEWKITCTFDICDNVICYIVQK